MALAVIGIVMSVRNKKYNVLTRKTRSIKDKAVSLKKTEKSEPKKDNTDIDELLKDLERDDENS